MSISKVIVYSSVDDANSTSITVQQGDLIVVDCTSKPTGSPITKVTCTRVTGDFAQVGTNVSNNTSGRLVAINNEWMGVAASSGTATVSITTTAGSYKHEISIYRDAALAPNVAWSVDSQAASAVTGTTSSVMTGAAGTSATANSVYHGFFLPENAGKVGTTAGFTWSLGSVSWYQVLCSYLFSAVGTNITPTASQVNYAEPYNANSGAANGQFIRRGSIFKAVGTVATAQAAATFAGAGAALAGATQTRSVGSVFAGQGAIAPGATRVQGTGSVLAGSGSLVASANPPAAVLNLGNTPGKNYFALQYAVPGDSTITTKSLADLVAGFSVGPQFYTTSDDQRVHFEARIDAPTTSGSNYSRSELREVDASGANFGFDALTGTHSMSGTTTITHLPTVLKAVMVAQLQNGSVDRVCIRTQLVTGTVRLRLRVNGSTVGTDLIAPYTEGTEFSWKIEVVDGTLNVYFGVGGSVNPTPVYTSTALVSTGSPSWYWKTGLYNQSNVADGESATDYGSAELRNLSVSHSLPASSAQAPLSGAGALSAGTFLGKFAGQTLAGAGALSATSTRTTFVPLDISAQGSLSVSATAVNRMVGSYGGAGALTAEATKTHAVAAALTGQSSLFIAVTPNGNASLSGAGALSATAFQSQRVAVTGGGAGALAADPFQLHRVTAALTGAGAITADGARVQQGSGSLAALGSASFDGRRVQPASSVEGGAGSLSASGTRVHAAQVSMGAFGTFQARSATEVGGALNVSVYLVDRASGALRPLPDFQSVTVSPILNENGAIELQYPAWGKNFDLLRGNITNDRDVEVEVWLSGRRSSALRGILMDSSGDDVAELAVWTFSGPFLNYLMSEIRVFPQPAAEKQELIISAASAGKVIRTIVQQAQARGSLVGLTLGFSDTVDSNGLPWVNNLTTTYSPGITGKAVLDSLVTLGMVEWEITKDRVLKAYAPLSFGIDRTMGTDTVTLRRGKQVPEAPRKHTVRDSTTTMLAAGSDGIYNSANDPAALSRRGRRIEGYATANNLTETAAVYGFAQTALNASSPGVMELTQAVEFTPGDPRPGAAYNVGDWVYADTRNKLERLRVKQWSLTVDESGASGTVSLNDLITERSVTLAKRLDALSNGTATVGTSSSADDTGIPIAPVGLLVGSDPYVGPNGEALATITVGWTAVTKNTDGKTATDISGYNVEYKYNSGITQSGWTSVGSTDQTQKSFADVSSGENIDVRVQTVDRSNNVSAWSATASHLVLKSTTPPAVPSTPSVENYLGVIRVTWDGLSSTGAVMEANFDYTEVHISTSAIFTPSDSTLVGTMFGKQTLVYIDGVYGTTYYARLVAVNTTPIKSGPSGVASAAPERVVGTDVFDGAIGTAKLADAAITTAKINDLAVNDAKIGSLNVGKLTTGVFTADMTLSGSIKTATIGARSEIDAAGIRLYNTSGTLTVRLQTSNGSALITGQYQTAISGERLVMNPGGTEPNTVRLYPMTGSQYAQLSVLTSLSTSFPNQAGASLKGYSPRSDHASGEVSVFPGYASLAFADENGGGTVYSRISAEIHQAGMSAARLQFSTGVNTGNSDDGVIRFGVTNPSTGGYYSPSVIEMRGSGDGTGNARMNGQRNSGIQFDTNILSITTGTGGLGPLQASNVVAPSARRLKTDFAKLPFHSVGAVQGARPEQWRYKTEDPAGPRHIGPMADDLPDALVYLGENGIPSIDHGSLIGTLWDAVGKLADRLDELEKVSS